eukprot:775144-Pelagomonas_calceolata.AAC.1
MYHSNTRTFQSPNGMSAVPLSRVVACREMICPGLHTVPRPPHHFCHRVHTHAQGGSPPRPAHGPKYVGNAPTPLVLAPAQIAMTASPSFAEATPPPFSLSRLSRTLVSWFLALLPLIWAVTAVGRASWFQSPYEQLLQLVQTLANSLGWAYCDTKCICSLHPSSIWLPHPANFKQGYLVQSDDTLALLRTVAEKGRACKRVSWKLRFKIDVGRNSKAREPYPKRASRGITAAVNGPGKRERKEGREKAMPVKKAACIQEGSLTSKLARRLGAYPSLFPLVKQCLHSVTGSWPVCALRRLSFSFILVVTDGLVVMRRMLFVCCMLPLLACLLAGWMDWLARLQRGRAVKQRAGQARVTVPVLVMEVFAIVT